MSQERALLEEGLESGQCEHVGIGSHRASVWLCLSVNAAVTGKFLSEQKQERARDLEQQRRVKRLVGRSRGQGWSKRQGPGVPGASSFVLLAVLCPVTPDGMEVCVSLGKPVSGRWTVSVWLFLLYTLIHRPCGPGLGLTSLSCPARPSGVAVVPSDLV